jgi:hypothetical protein
MTKPIEAPLELVVACKPEGVVIHPGGYRLSRTALAKDGALRRDLETIVLNRAMLDPGIRPRPRLQFLVEPGGMDTYREARRRTVLNDLSWPVSVELPESQAVTGLIPKERF